MTVLPVLLLALAWPHQAAAGPPKRFNSYIVNPASYLDVLSPAGLHHNPEKLNYVSAAAAGCSRANSINSTSASSSAGSAHGHIPVTPAAEYIHNEPSICSEPHTDTITDSTAHRRVILQAPANPLRLQKPYLVCVSPWVPMVQCDPNTDPAGWKGRCLVHALHVPSSNLVSSFCGGC